MSMEEQHLLRPFSAYQEWKAGLIETIRELNEWLERQELAECEFSLSIFEAVEALRRDRFTVAFVAEFSRGKSELINAIFFADRGRRLLPSSAGRTTMCPTEIFFDAEAEEPFLRLLPIESRLEETTIGEHKRHPEHWNHITLDTEDPDQMESALAEIVRTKEVERDRARQLGLYSREMHEELHPGDPEPERVEIPVWRHALINFPHPLLRQGLVILDTPGLNALGNEPELTMSMLPSAQALLFVLAADTGVTQSDLTLWHHHLKRFRKREGGSGCILVTLNKVDTLWDDLKDDEAIEAMLARQVEETAKTLEIEPRQVFPVSAQKALVGRIRNDPSLHHFSRIASLERHLSEEVLPHRETLLREMILGHVRGLIDTARNTLESRRNTTRHQLGELRMLSGRNSELIHQLIARARREQSLYQRNIEGFQASRRLLRQRARLMRENLSLEGIDRLIRETREAMAGSWTTVGLKRGMQSFFDSVLFTMEQVAAEAEETRQLVNAIYRKFETEHGLKATPPEGFPIDRYYRRMQALYEEGEAFRRSPVTTMTEQNFVIKKFFINMVSNARDVLFQANRAMDKWLAEVLNPLVSQIKQHRTAMEKRLQTLRSISESRDTLRQRLEELEREFEMLGAELEHLDAIEQRLLATPSSERIAAA